MKFHHLIRYSEIALKGKNRGVFEKILMQNIKALASHHDDEVEVKRLRGRIIIISDNELRYLSDVLGIQSLSIGLKKEADFADIKEGVIELLQDKVFETFRVTTKRQDKNVPFTSHELDCKIGEFVMVEYDKKVKLKGADIDIGIEVIENHAYVFIEVIKGYGGLPVGSSGNVLVRLTGNYELSAWLMMKRGCTVVFEDAPKLQYLDRFNMYKEFEIRQSGDAVVVDMDADAFVNEEKTGLILSPLIGYSTEMKEELVKRLTS